MTRSVIQLNLPQGKKLGFDLILTDSGLRVTQLVPGSHAEVRGLREEDLVLKVSGFNMICCPKELAIGKFLGSNSRSW